MMDRGAWCVSFQMHDEYENFGISYTVVRAESISEALEVADREICDLFEENHWSDYHITGINYVPELH